MQSLLTKALAATALTAFFSLAPSTMAADPVPAAGQRLNILLITVDDMNFDTPNIVKGTAPDITPNIDALARQGFRFVNSHVTVAVCQPSRETLMTGRYPHRSGAIGFVPVNKDCPTLEESLKAAGYDLGILGKVGHLAPPEKFPWDYKHDAYELGMGRDPAQYYKYTKEFLTKAQADHKPFFLMANSHDPHRPFAGSVGDKNANEHPAAPPEPGTLDKGDGSRPNKHPDPTRTYKPEEVNVPAFLPDLPDVRTELAQYCSSAHRADESVGQVLKALKESGMEENTVVIFLSDNGMSFPYAKSNCYLTSTRTPLIVRWPGHTKAGTVDTENFVAGIDFMPTVLDMANLPQPAGMDGRSYMPLLKGEKQEGRNHVFTVYNENAAKQTFTMRCYQDKHFGYIYNPWSDGKMEYHADNITGLTFKAMQDAGKENTDIANRVELYLHRVPEEFYDLEKDPACLHNLIKEPAYQEKITQYRQTLVTWMHDTQDPIEKDFRVVMEHPTPAFK